eukprot:CAMPEP_0116141560 /NCGR_PEP_ID=MMETSP0329-20121206/14445_1 /TAXON_ID=697910 /ORGANISM="Pseudo-nitzschia arenysensis, Strain B593" /LENGTH=698 /DNA_ID=CAMNT_0003636747 /DNA_START=36 /DNA_END=2132 /DNA_ORIENTATION=-
MGANNRRQLARTCKKFGLLVQPKALQALMQEMEERGDRFLDLLGVFKERLSRTPGPNLVSLQLLELVLEEEQQKRELALQKANKRKKNKIVLQDEIEDDESQLQQERIPAGNSERPDIFRSQPKAKPRRVSNAVDSSSPSAMSSRNSKPWKLVSAFDMPKLVYDSMGRQFHYDFVQKSLMGTAKDLMDMRIHRYQLVKQKVDRHREQRRLSPLTTIDRLLGATNSRKSSHDSAGQRTLLGMLHSNPSLGCLELEDPTGSVPLRIDLSSSSALFSSSEATHVDTNGLYLEGSMVLVTGYQEESELSLMTSNMEDSSGTVFRCTSIELPPLENNTETRNNLPPSPYSSSVFDNGFRKPELKKSLPIYSLSNLSLDEENCIERVGDVIDRMSYDTSDSGKGAILVLFGNFCTETLSTSNALDELARLLQEKEIPSKHSILLVPGPDDVGSNACWPLPAWTKRNTPSSLHPFLASDMEGQITKSNRSASGEGGNVYLCTNPCRLEISDGRQVVLMRKDLIRESLQHQVLGNADSQQRSSESQEGLPPLASRVFYHTLSQCHLSPSSSSQQASATSCSPIYWNYDHSMALYPVPDLMILGLDAEYLEEGANYGRAGCHVVSPISNPSRNEWQCSVTTLGSNNNVYVEFDDTDEDEEEEMGVVDEIEEMEVAEPSQTDEEIYEKYRVLAGTQDTQLSQTQLSAY